MVLNREEEERGEEEEEEKEEEGEEAAAETSTENGEQATVRSIRIPGEGEVKKFPPPPPSSSAFLLDSEQASSPLAKSQEGSSKGAPSEVVLSFSFFPLFFFLFPFFSAAALSRSLATPHCSDAENSSSPSSSPSSGCVAAIWRREAEKRDEEEEEEGDASSGTENFSPEKLGKASTTSYSLFPPFVRKHQGTAEFSPAGIQQQPAETQLAWSAAPPGHCSRGPAGLQRSGEEEVEVEKKKKKSETTRKTRPGIETGIFIAVAFLA